MKRILLPGIIVGAAEVFTVAFLFLPFIGESTAAKCHPASTAYEIQATVSPSYCFFGTGEVHTYRYDGGYLFNGQYLWTSYSLQELVCAPNLA